MNSPRFKEILGYAFVVYGVDPMRVLCEAGVESRGDERLLEVLIRDMDSVRLVDLGFDPGINSGVDEQHKNARLLALTSNRKSALSIWVNSSTRNISTGGPAEIIKLQHCDAERGAVGSSKRSHGIRETVTLARCVTERARAIDKGTTSRGTVETRQKEWCQDCL